MHYLCIIILYLRECFRLTLLMRCRVLAQKPQKPTGQYAMEKKNSKWKMKVV